MNQAVNSALLINRMYSIFYGLSKGVMLIFFVLLVYAHENTIYQLIAHSIDVWHFVFSFSSIGHPMRGGNERPIISEKLMTLQNAQKLWSPLIFLRLSL